MAWLNTTNSAGGRPLASGYRPADSGTRSHSSSVAAGCIRMRYYHFVLGIVLASVIAGWIVDYVRLCFGLRTESFRV